MGVRQYVFFKLDAVGLVSAADVHAPSAGGFMGISGAVNIDVDLLGAIPIADRPHVEPYYHFIVIGGQVRKCFRDVVVRNIGTGKSVMTTRFRSGFGGRVACQAHGV